MSDTKSNDMQRLQAFIDAYLESLQRLPDEEVLSGNQSQLADATRFDVIVRRAKQAAGRRRLQGARRALDERSVRSACEETMDLAEARRFIAEAVNDGRFTLAARDLNNMSDEDVVRIYRQMRDLGIRSSSKKR